MDSNSLENPYTKAEFPEPSNDAASRKYRRRSPVGGSSSSSDGSPQHQRDNIPATLRKNISKIAGNKPKKDGESYKHTDGQSSRNYNRHNDHGRCDRHVDDYDRGYSKSSSRGQDSRDIGYSRGDKESRYTDHPNDVDKHSCEMSDASRNRSRDTNVSDRAGSGRRHINVEGRNWDKDRVGTERIEIIEIGKQIMQVMGIIKLTVHHNMRIKTSHMFKGTELVVIRKKLHREIARNWIL